MDPRPVAFIDSGVGGLSYCSDFLHQAPGESLVYVADRAHFPYGPRSREEIVAILEALVARLIARFDPKLVVIACNTASVSALDALRGKFPQLPFVGTVPAIKLAAASSRKRHIGLLATERTVSDPYIQDLMGRFAADCQLSAIAAPELVQFVEKEYAFASEQRRRDVVSGYLARFRECGVDSLVLACTHFLFLAEEFKVLAAPSISVFDSREGVARRASFLLRERGALAETPSRGSRRLFVTGTEPCEPSWLDFASLCQIEVAGLLDAVDAPSSPIPFKEAR